MKNLPIIFYFGIVSVSLPINVLFEDELNKENSKNKTLKNKEIYNNNKKRRKND